MPSPRPLDPSPSPNSEAAAFLGTNLNDDSKEQAHVGASKGASNPEDRLDDFKEIFNNSADNWMLASRKNEAKGVLAWGASGDNALSMIERLEERIKNLKGTEKSPQRVEISF